ncbi:MAG TPA: LysE family transporter [Verrucomicrobiae bacterium]|nr:LysE family transporter [Verrucomicrobiae bacterium]
MSGTTLGNLLQPLIAGFICGFVVSVPVGPVNLTVINHALRRGFLRAFHVGLGAISAETIYATLLMAGHSSILDKPHVRDALRVIAVVVIVGVGLRSLLFKPEKFQVSEAVAERVDERWHHPQAFLLGFILTVSNLMLVVLWATLAAVLFAREWVQPEILSRATCSVGVFVGGTAWFALLAYFVSRAHRRVKLETLTIMVRGCGVILIISAALLAYKLFQ